jgi:hypothetical protein
MSPEEMLRMERMLAPEYRERGLPASLRRMPEPPVGLLGPMPSPRSPQGPQVQGSPRSPQGPQISGSPRSPTPEGPQTDIEALKTLHRFLKEGSKQR